MTAGLRVLQQLLALSFQLLVLRAEWWVFLNQRTWTEAEESAVRNVSSRPD